MLALSVNGYSGTNYTVQLQQYGDAHFRPRSTEEQGSFGTGLPVGGTIEVHVATKLLSLTSPVLTKVKIDLLFISPGNRVTEVIP